MMWHGVECYTCNISIREKKKMEDAGDRLSAAYDELAAPRQTGNLVVHPKSYLPYKFTQAHTFEAV